eukprot:1694900-Pyramimonas_sp.AAC.1
MMTVLKAPNKFPKEYPVGPVPGPPQGWDQVIALLERQGTQQDLDAGFGKFMGLLEQEPIAAHGIPESEKERYVGRGPGWKVTRVPSLPPPQDPTQSPELARLRSQETLKDTPGAASLFAKIMFATPLLRSSEEWKSLWYLTPAYLSWRDSEAPMGLHETACSFAKKLEAIFASSRARQWRGSVQQAAQAGGSQSIYPSSPWLAPRGTPQR